MNTRPLLRTAPLRAAAAGLLAAAALSANANPFPDGDPAEGKAMHAKHCVECHARQFGGEDGTEIYTRFERRVTTASALAQQITTCTTMLNLDLFPEDEQHLAAYLNQHYYKFQ
ncbi:c-type cytochrome [Thauera sp. SDU_THAU2]|uniref:c-type cytochrome n=1 Tax=Thauera sp. SDU_THAU2 TaxID=3136633 RepID=UPI00311D6CE0